MEFRVLRYFLAVAREQSISAAAQALHLTQPTLSRQLRELEEELGKQLMVRGSRRIELTEDGMLLRKRAEEIMELVSRTQAELSSPDEAVTGDVYIGTGETDGVRRLARAARRLRESCPGIRFHIVSGDASDVCERLDKGLLDFGLFVGMTDLKKYDYLTLPYYHRWGLIMRKDDSLAKEESITPDMLPGLPLLCSRQALIQNELSGWLGIAFEELNIIGTYNLIYNAAVMVEEGLGYAVCIDKLANTSEESPLCFRPFEPAMKVDMFIAWKKYQIFSAAAKKLLEILQDELED